MRPFFCAWLFLVFAISCQSSRENKLAILKKAPNFSFQNQDGLQIDQSFYKDKVYVVEFFFTSCGNICPIMNEYLVKIQNEFLGRKDFGIASFTVDPLRDTPEVLKAYQQKIKATSPNWHFLTGVKDSIYHLIRTGYLSSVQKEEHPNIGGGFIHTDWFVLVDKEGNIRMPIKDGSPHFYSGTSSEDVFQLKKMIQKLLNE